MIVARHRLAQVQKEIGAEKRLITGLQGLGERLATVQFSDNEFLKRCDGFLGHGLTRGKLDETTQQPFGFCLRIIRFHLNAKAIKQHPMRSGRPRYWREGTFHHEPPKSDARLPAFREGWVTVVPRFPLCVDLW